MLGPLFDQRALLLVDVRGTGKSGAIDCPEVQEAFSNPTLDMVRACAALLGDASDLYMTVDAVNDIDDVREALGIEKLDFYGVSYGTQIGQVYSLYHGDRLRSLVLDSAYPITQRADLVDFDRITGDALLTAVSRICVRSFLCQRVGGDVDARMKRLIAELRRSPVQGRSYNPFGERVHVNFDEATLIAAISGYGYEPGPREIDGAASALRRGDSKPILRIGAGAIIFPLPPPTSLSADDYFAVTCTETSFPWAVSDPEDVRIAKWDAAFDAIPQGTFAPFSVSAWRETSRAGFVGMLATPQCAAWPAPDRDVPPLIPLGSSWTSAPTLIMNGDQDKVAPVEAARSLAGLYPNGTFVEFANAGHGVAGFTPCADGMIMTFIDTLATGDTSCAADPPPFYGYTTFPLDARDEIRPVERAESDRSTRPDRKAIAALVDTVVDGLLHTDTGHGLRGGRIGIEFTDTSVRWGYDRARFVRDVAVSGYVDYDFETGDFEGVLTITASGLGAGEVHYFDPADPAASIEIRGTIGGRRIALDLPDVT